MASLSEFTIVKIQVLNITTYNEKQNRELNAYFGMTAAFSLIDCMISETNKEPFCITLNNAINNRLQQILDDHKLCLETKDVNELPIFINAQFYELFEVFYHAPVQINVF